MKRSSWVAIIGTRMLFLRAYTEDEARAKAIARVCDRRGDARGDEASLIPGTTLNARLTPPEPHEIVVRPAAKSDRDLLAIAQGSLDLKSRI